MTAQDPAFRPRFAPSRRELLRKTPLALGAGLLTNPFAAPRAYAATPVKIGYISPQTGPLAPFSGADDYVLGSLRALFKQQNRPIEILTRDSQSNPNRAAEVAADLITRENVSLMLVGSPESDNPVSDQCELNETPCVSTLLPWDSWFSSRGGKAETPFKWTYHYFWGLHDAIDAFTAMWRQIDTNHVVGGVFANDSDGSAWGQNLPLALQKAGFKFIDPGRFETLAGNFSTAVAAFKSGSTEIVTGNMIPPDFTTFWTQARQQGLKPKICTIGKALLFPASVEALGAAANNLSTEVWWSPHHPFKSSLTGQSAFELASAFTKASGKQWTQPLGFIHALFELAADILGRSADPHDRAANLAALTATRLDTIAGHVDWSGGPVKNVALSPLVGGQWRAVEGGPFPFELLNVDNATAPMIPTNGKLLPIF